MIMHGQVANRVIEPEGHVVLIITANPDDPRNTSWGVPAYNGEGPRIWLTVTAEAAEAFPLDAPVTVTVA